MVKLFVHCDKYRLLIRVARSRGRSGEGDSRQRVRAEGVSVSSVIVMFEFRCGVECTRMERHEMQRRKVEIPEARFRF